MNKKVINISLLCDLGFLIALIAGFIGKIQIAQALAVAYLFLTCVFIIILTTLANKQPDFAKFMLNKRKKMKGINLYTPITISIEIVILIMGEAYLLAGIYACFSLYYAYQLSLLKKKYL